MKRTSISRWLSVPTLMAVACSTLVVASYGQAVAVTPTKGVAAISAGYLHNCALTVSGGVKCWGYNSDGQLGDKSNVESAVPVDVWGLSSGVTAIAAGGYHTCALTSAGAVKCWGYNSLGQLGDGTTKGSTSPVSVSGLSSGVAAISAGLEYTCALTTAGGVKCWGDNYYGQLGNGTFVDSVTPVDVSGLSSGITAISVGDYQTCALTTAGGVKCWGANDYGQLGNGSTLDSSTPVNVSNLSSGIAGISAAYDHTCALTTVGGVKCWGWNLSGQLGNGTTTRSLVPVDVLNLSDAADISAGDSHNCALTTAGAAKCWGYNFDGQLGDASETDRYTPVDVSGLSSGIAALSAGGSHTCSLAIAGGVKCWGANYYDQLGNASILDSSNIPVDVSGLPSIYSLSVTKSGTGAGTVASSPAGISCGATCAANFNENTVVTLTATPNASSTFAGWSGGGCSGTGTCQITMTADTAVSATFTIKSFTLSVSKSGTGTGTVTSSPAGISCGATCSAAFNYSTVVVLSATADASSTFAGWSGSGCSGTGTCQVTMTAAASVTATFTVRSFALSITKSGTGTGTVASSPVGISCGSTCSASFSYNTAVTLTATASSSSVFTGWSGGGCSGTGTCQVTMTAATSVTATFKPKAYQPDATISTSAAGTFVGGNIYNTTGTSQTVTINTARGGTATFFVNVENDGNVSDSFTLKGAGSLTGFTVAYFVGTTNITSGVTGGTYTTASLAPGGLATFKIVVTVGSTVSTGTSKSFLLTAASKTSTTKKDAVKATVSV